MSPKTHLTAGVFGAALFYKLNLDNKIIKQVSDITSYVFKFCTDTVPVITGYIINYSHLIATPLTWLNFLIGALITSNLADIDQKLKLGKGKGEDGIRHRGQTHSLLWPILLFLLSYVTKNEIIIGMGIGMLSHSAIDLLNGVGAEIFWPITSRNYRIMDVKYQGFMEKLLFGMMVVGIIMLLVNNFVDVKVVGSVVRIK